MPAAKEPITGPIMMPADVAAESHPRARARSSGRTVSATYAWATPVVPPPAPWMMREANSSHTLVASPKTVYAAADAKSPISSAGRRPYRSDTRPQRGAEIS